MIRRQDLITRHDDEARARHARESKDALDQRMTVFAESDVLQTYNWQVVDMVTAQCPSCSMPINMHSPAGLEHCGAQARNEAHRSLEFNRHLQPIDKLIAGTILGVVAMVMIIVVVALTLAKLP
jgi:hypothetical protein